MVEADFIPGYLTTSSALIKALKSAQDPPSPGWPEKIEIAKQCRERENFVLYRKDAVLKEWITEEFLKVKGSRSSKFNPLVDYRYHHLLGQLYLTEASSKISSFPLQPIVHNFFTTLRALGSKIEELERLLQAASSTLRVLFKAAHEDASAVAGKAEAWLETFGLMMGWLAKEDLGSSVVYIDHLIGAIGQELVVSLDVAQNRKKVTLSLSSYLPALLSVWHKYPLLRTFLDAPIQALLFSLPVLQSEDMSAGYLLPVISFHSDISSANKLEFMPHYLSLLVKSLQQNRYTLFPPTGSSRNSVPLDVHVSDRVRQAVLLCTEIALDTVDKVSSPTADAVARCRSKTQIWHAIKDWGGYLEGDHAWSALLQKTLMGVTLSSQSTQDLLLGSKIELLDVMVGLDYPACQLTVRDGNGFARSSRSVLSQALLVSTGEHCAKAQTLLLSITRYHALTHDTPGLVDVLCDCVREAMHMGSPKDAYQHSASGPLVSLPFRRSLSRNISDMLAGGASLDGGWAVSMRLLAQRLSECVTPLASDDSNAEGPRKKRRVNDGSSAEHSVANTSAAEYGILSRLVVMMLDTAIGESYNNATHLEPIITKHSVLWELPSDCKPESSWAQEVLSAGSTRLLRSATRYKSSEAVEGRVSTTSSLANPNQNGEHLYQYCLAALESAEKTGTFDNDAEHALEHMFNISAMQKRWSGLDVELDKTTLSPALWQALAIQALPVIEAYAPDHRITLLAQTLIGNAIQSISGDGLSVGEASNRILSTTTVWELPRVQESIGSLIKDLLLRAEPGHDDAAKVYSLLMIAPADYLNRPLRNLSMSKAFEWDLQLVSRGDEKETTILLRRYLSKIISETGYLGNLETANIDALVKASSLPLSAHVKSDASKKLLSQILRVLLRDPKNEKNSGVLSYLTGKLFNDLPKHPEIGMTCAVLLTSLSDMDMSFDILPSHILANLDELHRKLGKIVQKQDKSGDIHPLALSLHRALVVYSSWRNIGHAAGLDRDDTLPVRAIKLSLHRLASGEVPAATVLADLALPALDILSLQLEINTQEGSALAWTAYWLATYDAGSQAGIHDSMASLNTLFQRSVARATPSVFGTVLTSLLDRLASTMAEKSTKTESTLEALSLLLDLQIPNSGKVFKQSLSRVLALLHLILVGSSKTELKVQALRILESISERKPVGLSEQDASEIVLGSFAALLPASTGRDPQTHPEPLTLVLSICNSLVRHRRDLIINILPHLMKLYSRVFNLFVRPRAVAGSGKLRSIIINRRPNWLGPLDEDCLDVNSAAAVARSISTLTGRTTIRRGKNDDGSKLRSSGMERDLGSLVGQLSKHAPGILVAYTKAVADPLAGMPVAARREMEPGLFALCEAITAGGKAQYGKGPGEGVGEAFGLGEGDNADAEYEVWVDLWQRWSKKRYAGQG